jgi:DNA-binding winged helix-turn-helix (wHTH) protein
MRFAFDRYVLDSEDEVLVRDGARVPLRGKAFAVLRVLAENGGHLVTRERLLDSVWSDSSIHEQGLSVCIKEIREALGDDSRAPRYVKTEHRRGYRLVVPVTRIASSAPLETITHDERVGTHLVPRIAFVWSVGRALVVDVPLVDRALDLGRGPLGAFVLDDRTVSRRHVRVTCVEERWRVEDCRSHNGSWVNGGALAGGSVDAAEGALVRMGETIFALVRDPRVVVEIRSRCASIADAAGDAADVRASFVERALLETEERSPGDWSARVRRSCLGGGVVAAERWSFDATASPRREA